MTSRIVVSAQKHIVPTRMSYKLHPVDTAQKAVFYGQFKAVIPTATGHLESQLSLFSGFYLDTSQLNDKLNFVSGGQCSL